MSRLQCLLLGCGFLISLVAAVVLNLDDVIVVPLALATFFFLSAAIDERIKWLWKAKQAIGAVVLGNLLARLSNCPLPHSGRNFERRLPNCHPISRDSWHREFGKTASRQLSKLPGAIPRIPLKDAQTVPRLYPALFRVRMISDFRGASAERGRAAMVLPQRRRNGTRLQNDSSRRRVRIARWLAR